MTLGKLIKKAYNKTNGGFLAWMKGLVLYLALWVLFFLGGLFFSEGNQCGNLEEKSGSESCEEKREEKL